MFNSAASARYRSSAQEFIPKRRTVMAQVIHTGLIMLLAVLHLASVSGCAIVQYGTHANEGPVLTPPVPTRATTKISSSDLKNGTFLGIAMSGGGSRAA